MATPITEQRWQAEVPDWRHDDNVSPHPSDVLIANTEGWQTTVATVRAEGLEWGEVEARALVVAAAPELLAALKAMVDHDQCGRPNPAHRAADEAIAKAEGKP